MRAERDRDDSAGIRSPILTGRGIDFCSRRLKASRSRLLPDAAREYLARQRAPFDATASWNEVIAEAGQPGDDPAALALRRRSKVALGVTRAKRR